MKKTIGIIQPGRLGDIIICLPIAKYYSDQGYTVVWPVFEYLAAMLTDRIDYVKFVPVDSNVYKCVKEAKSILTKIDGIKIFDIAATFPDSDCTDEYVSLGDGFGEEKFDQFKYRKCAVPFSEKWKLYVKWNEEKIDALFREYVKSERYVVVGLNHSKGKMPIQIETDKQIVELNENHNIFDWIKILKHASAIVLVDSAMANLVEQLNLHNKKILITKPNQPTPTFKNVWQIK